MHTVDQVAFRRAHIKVEAAFLFHKAWQAVKIVYFLNGRIDRRRESVAMRDELSASAKSTLFARQVENTLHCTGRLISSAKTVAKNKMQFPSICATFLHYGSS